MGNTDSRLNDTSLDRMISENEISRRDIERAFRLVDRWNFIPESQRYATLPTMETSPPGGPFYPGRLHVSSMNVYATVLDYLSLKKGQTFLNVGSGSGYFSTICGIMLGDTGNNHGIELYQNLVNYSESCIEKWIESPEASSVSWARPEIKTCDISNEDFLNDHTDRYDRIYVGFQIPDTNMLKRIVRMLKIGGILVMPKTHNMSRYTRTAELECDCEDLAQTTFASIVVLPDHERPPSVTPFERIPSLCHLSRVALRRKLRKEAYTPHIVKRIYDSLLVERAGFQRSAHVFFNYVEEELAETGRYVLQERRQDPVRRIETNPPPRQPEQPQPDLEHVLQGLLNDTTHGAPPVEENLPQEPEQPRGSHSTPHIQENDVYGNEQQGQGESRVGILSARIALIEESLRQTHYEQQNYRRLLDTIAMPESQSPHRRRGFRWDDTIPRTEQRETSDVPYIITTELESRTRPTKGDDTEADDEEWEDEAWDPEDNLKKNKNTENQEMKELENGILFDSENESEIDAYVDFGKDVSCVSTLDDLWSPDSTHSVFGSDDDMNSIFCCPNSSGSSAGTSAENDQCEKENSTGNTPKTNNNIKTDEKSDKNGGKRRKDSRFESCNSSDNEPTSSVNHGTEYDDQPGPSQPSEFTRTQRNSPSFTDGPSVSGMSSRVSRQYCSRIHRDEQLGSFGSAGSSSQNSLALNTSEPPPEIPENPMENGVAGARPEAGSRHELYRNLRISLDQDIRLLGQRTTTNDQNSIIDVGVHRPYMGQHVIDFEMQRTHRNRTRRLGDFARDAVLNAEQPPLPLQPVSEGDTDSDDEQGTLEEVRRANLAEDQYFIHFNLITQDRINLLEPASLDDFGDLSDDDEIARYFSALEGDDYDDREYLSEPSEYRLLPKTQWSSEDSEYENDPDQPGCSTDPRHRKAVVKNKDKEQKRKKRVIMSKTKNKKKEGPRNPRRRRRKTNQEILVDRDEAFAAADSIFQRSLSNLAIPPTLKKYLRLMRKEVI